MRIGRVVRKDQLLETIKEDKQQNFSISTTLGQEYGHCTGRKKVPRPCSVWQPLVFDMAYDDHMKPYELQNAVSQLLESEGCNRRNVDPFSYLFLGNLKTGESFTIKS